MEVIDKIQYLIDKVTYLIDGFSGSNSIDTPKIELKYNCDIDDINTPEETSGLVTVLNVITDRKDTPEETSGLVTVLNVITDRKDTIQMTFLIQDKQFMKFVVSNNAINMIIDMFNAAIDSIYDNNYDKLTNYEDPRYSEMFGFDSVYYVTYNPKKSNPNLTQSSKITKETLDSLYNYTEVSDESSTNNIYQWDLPFIDRSFDPIKIKEYLSSFGVTDKKMRDITEKIIENTEYISFSSLKETLIKQIDRLPDKVNIYFDIKATKIGSEHWFIILLWPYLKNKIHKIITSWRDIDNTYPILIIDDAMYSGQTIINNIDYLQSGYNLLDGDSENIYIESIKKNSICNKILHSQILILVGYTSSTAIWKIQEYSKYTNIQIFIYTENITSPMILCLIDDIDHKKKQARESVDYLPYIDYMRKKFNAMDTNVAIYFDHKIGGIHSSFPDIYNKLVKNAPSREKIEKLETLITSLE